MKRLLNAAVAAAVVVAVLTAGTPPAQARGVADRYCRTARLAVSLAPGRSVRHYVVVDHCQPRRWAPVHAVDVFTDGATFTRYWDWPAQRRHSVVAKVLAAGRATVTYDRIGTGRSSRLPSAAVTVDLDAWILEQVLRSLRPYHYRQVTSWLHADGSAIGIRQATIAGFTRPDRLIVTGFLHVPQDPAGVPPTRRANQDRPQWRELDDGWLTTVADTRAIWFHSPDTSPTVVAADERRKDVISATALAGLVAQRGAPPSANPSAMVTPDVVLAVGQYDARFCRTAVNCADPAAVRTYEAAYYRAAASLNVVVAPAGHSLALDPSGDRTFQRINALITSH